MAININKFFRNDRTLILAYDHGLEHGPTDFNEKSVDPSYVLDIALEAGYTGVVLHHGIVEKYYKTYFKEVPLILKLNAHTRIGYKPLISTTVCSVERAIRLGADAVGYTIYVGSHEEPEMLTEFSSIVEKAHEYGIPVVAWAYPRGSGINELDTDTIAYAVRIAMELGADMIKTYYNGDKEGLKWIIKNAGKARLVIAGGEKIPDMQFLKRTEEVLSVGADGIAVGRNIFQSKRPFTLSKALAKIVFHNSTAEEAARILPER
ncbi:fructose-bisphosphate aldolase [Candidatus Woesearchaeota archaeon]|nr:fructose-bisphosphate aldolase [Candidatus Woesearchaeota archaeon]